MKTLDALVVILCTFTSVAVSQRCTNISENGSPVLKFTTFPANVTFGGEVNIVCVAVRPMSNKYATPNPFEITFFKGEKVLKVPECVDDPFEKAKQIKVCLLNLKELSEKDLAVYTCQARNAYGCTYTHMKLRVKVSPKEKFLRWISRQSQRTVTVSKQFGAEPLVF